MKKFFLTISLLLFCTAVNAEILEAGVSIEEIPKVLFGTWRINAKLDTTNSYKTFKPQSVDIWELSRVNNKFHLSNPNSGAKAEVSVKTVEGNIIVFSKKTPYDNNKVLIDIVHIRLDGETFTGINNLILESFSAIDKHLIKTETAQYIIKGEKLTGNSILAN